MIAIKSSLTPVHQIRSLQMDLQNLSEMLEQLEGLPAAELAALELSSHLTALHHDLQAVETVLRAARFSAPEDLPEETNWPEVETAPAPPASLKKDAHQVRRLSSQLALAMSRLQADLQDGAHRSEDVWLINHILNAASGSFNTGWCAME